MCENLYLHKGWNIKPPSNHYNLGHVMIFELIFKKSSEIIFIKYLNKYCVLYLTSKDENVLTYGLCDNVKLLTTNSSCV